MVLCYIWWLFSTLKVYYIKLLCSYPWYHLKLELAIFSIGIAQARRAFPASLDQAGEGDKAEGGAGVGQEGGGGHAAGRGD